MILVHLKEFEPIYQTIDQNYNLFDILNTNELLKEFGIRELLIFKHYNMVSKEIKCPFQW
jgi:hypothetical protein